jgi:NADH-quinone oxidoreductase subunit K
MLNAVNVLLVTAGSLPATGLAGLRAPTSGAAAAAGAADATDPLLPGPVMAIVIITVAAAEIGLALAIVLLAFRERATSDLTAMRELGEASPSYEGFPDAGELPPGTVTGLDVRPGRRDGAEGAPDTAAPRTGPGSPGSPGSPGAPASADAPDAGQISGQPTGAVR